MSVIYTTAFNLFNAQTDEQQETLYYLLEEQIEDALKEKQDNILTLALEEAEKNQKGSIWQHIQKTITKKVDVHYYQHNNIDHVSQLILIPFLAMFGQKNITLPALKTMEHWWQNALIHHKLIPKDSTLNFSPMLLGRKSATKLTRSEWYNLHITTCNTLDKREQRAIFDAPFNIQLEPETSQLSFFVAIVSQPAFNAKPIALINPEEHIYDSILLALDDITNIYLDQIDQSTWLFMPLGSVTEVIANSYDTFQNVLVGNLIKNYAQDPKMEFAIVPTDNNNVFALMAWHPAKNTVFDAVIMYQYTKDYNELIDYVMNILDQSGVNKVYLGDENIEELEFEHLQKIDFDKYLRVNGANVIQTQ